LWTNKSIREIAKSVGREREYERPYAVACAIRHLNFEGLLAHYAQQEGELQFETPPSTRWIRKALVAASKNLLRILDTLNECCALGYDAQLEDVRHSFSIWRK